jgi:PiT family inorganic phosphate transporter
MIYYIGLHITRNLMALSLSPVTPAIVLAALTAAVIWKIVTIGAGIPTSSAHALVGGLTGAIMVAYGWQGLSQVIFRKIIIILLLTPVASFIIGYLLMHIALFFLRRATPQANKILAKMQLLTVALASVLHGATEPQKTIAVFVLALAAFGYQNDLHAPVWVIVTAVVMIAVGILAGGWRIAKTFNRRLMKIRPIDSVITQISASVAILTSALLGGTFSTSQIIGSSMVGAGAAQQMKQVSWRVARNIMVAWLVTIPVSGILAVIIWKILEFYVKAGGGVWV